MVIKAVLFDMDGTILDSEYMHTKVLQEVVKERTGIDISKEEIRKYIGLRYSEKLEKIFTKRGIKKDTKKLGIIVKEKSLENSHLVKKMDEADEIIQEMKENFKIALVTGSSKEQAEIFLEGVNLKKYFDIMISSSDVKRKKPYPDCYLVAAEKLKVKPKECVVIEDSVVGVEGAKNAEMFCIAIPNKYIKNGNFSKADLIVDSLKEITSKMIKRLN